MPVIQRCACAVARVGRIGDYIFLGIPPMKGEHDMTHGTEWLTQLCFANKATEMVVTQHMVFITESMERSIHSDGNIYETIMYVPLQWN